MTEENPVFLNEANIKNMLSWDTLIPTVEHVLSAISNKDETETIQPPRLITPIPSRQGAMLCMPSFSGEQNIFGCKVVTSFRKNIERGMPSINGTIILLDSETGRLKLILEANEITAWRTAAASVVGTKHLHKGDKKVLAILGAGVQGKSHALAMHHFFQFSEIRIWNRTHERAKTLCAELGSWAKPFESSELCVRGADVIVTATYAAEPIIETAWLQPGVHINAVGASRNHYSELPLDVYRRATVVVDTMAAAVEELRGLVASGIQLFCELGEVIRGVRELPGTHQFTVFQSLGMSLEDVATAELIYKQLAEKRC